MEEILKLVKQNARQTANIKSLGAIKEGRCLSREECVYIETLRKEFQRLMCKKEIF